MANRVVKIPTADISADISNYTIGLAKLSEHNRVENASLSGTGTLVSVGKVHGLLTAAHVLDALPSEGAVGVILFRSRQLQKQVIEMEHAVPLSIRAEQFDQNGPDLGFLRLPPKNVGWLNALNSFYNMTKWRGEVLAKQKPAQHFAEALIGMIEELTEEIPVAEPLRRAKSFSAIFCNGESKNTRDKNGFDLVDVTPTAYPDFAVPKNFKGMSGGALWRMYFVEREGASEIVARHLVGVPFHQSVGADGARIITCHGEKGIYTTLLEKIAEKWPDEME